MPGASFLSGDEPNPQTPPELPPWSVPLGGQPELPRLPTPRPARFEAFNIIRSGRPRMRLPDEITEAQRLAEDVRGLTGTVIFGSAGGAALFSPGDEPKPATPTPRPSRQFQESDLGGGSTRAAQLRAMLNHEGEFARRMANDVADAATEAIDLAGAKGGKTFGEVLVGRVVQLAEGLGRAPGVEAGARIFMGTAGEGEEGRIALQQAQEDALRASLNLFNGVAIRVLAPTRADPVYLPGPDREGEQQVTDEGED